MATDETTESVTDNIARRAEAIVHAFHKRQLELMCRERADLDALQQDGLAAIESRRRELLDHTERAFFRADMRSMQAQRDANAATADRPTDPLADLERALAEMPLADTDTPAARQIRRLRDALSLHEDQEEE